MITLIFILIFCGSFCFYNTSKKAILNISTIEEWLQMNAEITKFLGGLFYVTALVISMKNFGITSGILYWTFLLATILCLIIIIAPLKKVNYKHLIFGLLALVIIQLLN